MITRVTFGLNEVPWSSIENPLSSIRTALKKEEDNTGKRTVVRFKLDLETNFLLRKFI